MHIIIGSIHNMYMYNVIQFVCTYTCIHNTVHILCVMLYNYDSCPIKTDSYESHYLVLRQDAAVMCTLAGNYSSSYIRPKISITLHVHANGIMTNKGKAKNRKC